MPLMLEKSMQARFLIPMAVSLAFGVMFATFITLILIPSGYMVMEDIKGILQLLTGSRASRASKAPATPTTVAGGQRDAGSA